MLQVLLDDVGLRLQLMLDIQPGLVTLGEMVEHANVFAAPRPRPTEEEENPRYTNPTKYFTEYKRILTSPDPEDIRLRDLQWLSTRMAACTQALQGWFDHFYWCGTGAQAIAAVLAESIMHPMWQLEAKTHVAVIAARVEELKRMQDRGTDVHVLSTDGQHVISLLTEVQERRDIVEDLLKMDRDELSAIERRVFWYSLVGGGIIAALIVLGLVLPAFGRATLAPGDLEKVLLPVVLIPWPVVVWSLIGGFAAAVHRFNANPTHDSEDAVRWLVTRPLQGLLLGSAMYLVLRSGMMVLTPTNTTDGVSSFVILVLCFLVAFSDRFATSILDTLIHRDQPHPPAEPLVGSHTAP